MMRRLTLLTVLVVFVSLALGGIAAAHHKEGHQTGHHPYPPPACERAAQPAKDRGNPPFCPDSDREGPPYGHAHGHAKDNPGQGQAKGNQGQGQGKGKGNVKGVTSVTNGALLGVGLLAAGAMAAPVVHLSRKRRANPR